jgi:hypothetical protein
LKRFGEITRSALQCAWRAKKARRLAAVGGFHTEAEATGVEVDITPKGIGSLERTTTNTTDSVVLRPNQWQPAITDGFDGPGLIPATALTMRLGVCHVADQSRPGPELGIQTPRCVSFHAAVEPLTAPLVGERSTTSNAVDLANKGRKPPLADIGGPGPWGVGGEPRPAHNTSVARILE